MKQFEPGKEPIFILGIMPRSGTNFLNYLLASHPQCQAVTGKQEMPEDYLLYHANLLIRYADVVSNYWNIYWRSKEQLIKSEKNKNLEERLCKNLGDGIIHFLDQKAVGRIILTKTPSVRYLKYFTKLFPQARLLILVRDGRAVAESLVKSFGWSYEFAMQKWAEAARNVIEFERSAKNSNCQYLIIKYEELLDNLEEELTRIFEFLNLNTQIYNFDKASQLPIFGSSEFFCSQKDSQDYGWKKVEKTENFQPKLRFSHWNQAKHRRFNWIAENYMQELGYEIEYLQPNHILSNFWNRILDRKWQGRNLLKSSIESWEKKLYALLVYDRHFRYLELEE